MTISEDNLMFHVKPEKQCKYLSTKAKRVLRPNWLTALFGLNCADKAQ